LENDVKYAGTNIKPIDTHLNRCWWIF